MKPNPLFKRKFLVLTPVVAAVLLGACGSSEGTAAGGSSTTVVAFTGAAADDLQKCLADNGVTSPEGGLGARPGAGAAAGALPSLPEGVDQAALQKAFAECGGQIPGGGAGLPGNGGPDLSAFTTCLKDNGVNIADGAAITDLPIDDPAFQAASQTCAPLLPAEGALPGGAAPSALPGAAPTTVAQ
jgi:hypothetical protein